MLKTVFTDATRPESVLELRARAQRVGFDHVALTVGEQEGILFSMPEAACRSIREEFEHHGLRVAALVLTDDPPDNVAATEPDGRTRAIRRTRTALEHAAWLGAGTLIASPVHVAPGGSAPLSPRRYADALNRTHTALQELRFVAERYGVTLALGAPCAGFLLSPVELRDLLDEQASPRVGACIDVSEVLRIGSPDDWVVTLGHRACAVWLGSDRRDARVAGTGPIEACIPSLVGTLRCVAFPGIIGAADDATLHILRDALSV